MGQWQDYRRPDGAQARAYWAPAAHARALVVVIHEWWGVNPQICGVADRLAQVGWAACVPDLFGGRVTRRAEEAGRWMAELNTNECITQILAGAVRVGADLGLPVALLGFCMGGALALAAGARLHGLAGVVSFYGIPEQREADVTSIPVPVLGHFARRDSWCTMARVRAWRQAMRAGGQVPKVYWYDADHAFFNEARPEVYDPVSAAHAWTRTHAFLLRITQRAVVAGARVRGA